MEKPHTKFNELTRKQKTEHIIEYYKIHIGVAIVVILVFGWMLNHYIINPPPSTGLDITVFSLEYNVDDLEGWGEELGEIFFEKKDNETVLIEHFMMAEDMDPHMQMAMVTKTAAKIQLQELDLCIFEGDTYQELYGEETLRSLDDILVELEGFDVKTIKDSELGGESDDVVFIDLSDNAKIKEHIFTENSIYVAIHLGSQHIDTTIEWFKYILE